MGWTPEELATLIASRPKPSAARAPISVAGFDPFVELLRANGLPLPAREVVFARPRKWRADYLWEAPRRLIVEREGGIWSQDDRARAAHAKPLKIIRDMEKGNAAQLLGYIYLRFQPSDLDSGKALGAIRQALQSVSPQSHY